MSSHRLHTRQAQHTRDATLHGQSDFSEMRSSAATESEPEGLSKTLPPHMRHLRVLDLEGAKGAFTGVTLDLHMTCTGGEDRACHIVRHLSAWNEFLWEARLELRQLAGTRGKLSLSAIEGARFLYPYEDQAHKVASLLHWLLKRHRCVSVVDLTSDSLKLHKILVLEAIRGNSSIETLKLGFSFRSGNLLRAVATALSSLENLKELECKSVGKCPAQFVSALCALLHSTPSLTKLQMTTLEVQKHQAEALLTALAVNTALRELSIHESVIGEASSSHRCMLAEYLSKGSSLTALSICGCAQMRKDVLKWVLCCLHSNRTIADVVLPNVGIDEESAQVITQILSENTALRSFNMSGIRADRHMQPVGLFDSWLVALVKNDNLEEFTVPFRTWTPQQWEDFFHALSTKGHVRKITVELGLDDFNHLPKVYEMLRESGAGDKICFRSWVACCILDSLVWKEGSQCYAWLRSSTQPIFSRILRQLPSLSQVSSAHIDIWMPLVDEETSSVISMFLETTKTLKKLQLVFSRADFNAQYASRHWTSIVEALSRNRSVAELRMSAECVQEEDVELLAGVVKSSRTIHTVHYISERRCHTEAFFRLLSTGVKENYTILSVDLRGYVDKEAAMGFFAVRDVARRNSDLILRAAEFASGRRCDRYCAEALERISRHFALPEKVAQLASISEDQAVALIKESLRSLQGMHDFMRLAGVVRDRVVCEGHQEGNAQLDSLNDHCWRRVRRYLELKDVRVADAPKPII